MLYIFGTKSSNLNRNIKLRNVICDYCSTSNTIETRTYSKYFHFFFIPIFSLGKSTFAECSHCKKTFFEKEFTPDMKRSFAELTKTSPIKTPRTHSFGCFAIIAVILLFAFLVVIAYFKGDSKPDSVTQNTTKKLLELDKSKVVSNPVFETDSTSYYVKESLTLGFLGIDISGYKYFADVSNDKVLILVKTDNFKKIEAKSRVIIVDIIKEQFAIQPGYENKKLYIGIDGNWNMLLVSTPKEEDLKGKFANEDLLLDFYEPTSKDTLTIKK